MEATSVIDVETEEPRSTRDEILDAAERLFAERGFAAVSMRDIVSETSLKNQASLYHHFTNKRALYEAVLSRGLGHIFSMVPPQPTSSVEELNQNLDRLLDYLAAHPHLARLIQRAALDDARYVQGSLNNLLRPFYPYGTAALAGAGAGWSKGEIPHLGAGLYLLLFGYFANAPLLRYMLKEDPLSPEAVEHQRRFVKQAVARLLGISGQPAEGGAHGAGRG